MFGSENLRHRTAITRAKPYGDTEEARALLPTTRQDSADQFDSREPIYKIQPTAGPPALPSIPLAIGATPPNQDLELTWAKYEEIRTQQKPNQMKPSFELWEHLKAIQSSDKNSIFTIVEFAYVGVLMGYPQEATAAEDQLKAILVSDLLQDIKPSHRWNFLLNTLENKAFMESYQGQWEKLEVSLTLIKKIDPNNPHEEFLRASRQCFDNPLALIEKLQCYKKKLQISIAQDCYVRTNKHYFYEILHAYALATKLAMCGIQDASIEEKIDACVTTAYKLAPKSKDNDNQSKDTGNQSKDTGNQSKDTDNHWLLQSYQADIRYCLGRQDRHLTYVDFDTSPLALSRQVKEVILSESPEECVSLWLEIEHAYHHNTLGRDPIRAVISLVFLAIKLRDCEKCELAWKLLDEALAKNPRNVLLLNAKIALKICMTYSQVDKLLLLSHKAQEATAFFVVGPILQAMQKYLQLQNIGSVISKHKSTIKRYIQDAQKIGLSSQIIFRMESQLLIMSAELSQMLGQYDMAHSYLEELKKSATNFKAKNSNYLTELNWFWLTFIENKQIATNQTEKIKDLIFLGYVEPLVPGTRSIYQHQTIRSNLTIPSYNISISNLHELIVYGDFNLICDSNITSLPDILIVQGNVCIEDCIRLKKFPQQLIVGGHLFLKHCSGLTSLSGELTVGGDITIKNCINLECFPQKLIFSGNLSLYDCISLQGLPNDIKIHCDLTLENCTILGSLPQNITIGRDLTLRNCTGLASLPQNMAIGRDANIFDCLNLENIPQEITIGRHLALFNCSSLENISQDITISRTLMISGCNSLKSLPPKLKVGENLHLSGCNKLTHLPEELLIGGSLYLVHCSSLNHLPKKIDIQDSLFIRRCDSLEIIQAGMSIEKDLYLDDCIKLNQLPEHLEIKGNLVVNLCPSLLNLPRGLYVKGDLNLSRFQGLISLPVGLRVDGHLYLQGCTNLTSLSKGLQLGGDLNLRDCSMLRTFPDDLVFIPGTLDLRDCTNLSSLPVGLNIGGDLWLYDCTSLTNLPQGLSVGRDLLLYNCTKLGHLPKNLTVGGNLWLEDCTKLKSLSESLSVKGNLWIYDCTHIKNLPEKDFVVEGDLSLNHCNHLEKLPKNLSVGGNLKLYNCPKLSKLPENLSVGNNLKLYRCVNLKHLPAKIATWKKTKQGEIRHIYLKYSGIPEDTVIEGIQLHFLNSKQHEKNPQNITHGSYDLIEPENLPKNRTVIDGDLNVVDDMVDEDGIISLSRLSENLHVKGDLNLSNCYKLTRLPEYLRVDGNIRAYNCVNLMSLSENLCMGGDLNLKDCPRLRSLPEVLHVGGNFKLYNCTSLKHLPKKLQVDDDLWLDNCNNLISLPMKFKVGDNLWINGCYKLTNLPSGLQVGGWLDLRECEELTSLPADLHVGGNLSLIACKNIKELPANIHQWGRKMNGETRHIYLQCSGISQEIVDAILAKNPMGMEFHFDNAGENLSKTMRQKIFTTSPLIMH